MTRWKKTFNVPNKILEQLTGLSKQSIHQARNALVEHGLIKYQKGSRDEAPEFQMLSLTEDQNSKDILESHFESIPEALKNIFIDQTLDQTIDEKLKIHRHRQKETETNTEENFERFYK